VGVGVDGLSLAGNVSLIPRSPSRSMVTSMAALYYTRPFYVPYRFR